MASTYAFRAMSDAGVPLAGSSDCPVEPPHPLWGMASARDRCGLTPEQSLTTSEAHDLFTSGAATAIGEIRVLKSGAMADLVVLDGDPISSTPDELRAMQISATYVAGSPVDFPDIVTWHG